MPLYRIILFIRVKVELKKAHENSEVGDVGGKGLDSNVKPLKGVVENSMTSSSSDHDSSASLPSPPKQALMDDDFVKTLEQLSKQQSSRASSNTEQGVTPQHGNFRTVLKRPDLKGTFRCSICQKIFCHSSSLSRHRMQAHFKSYTCTLCRQEITRLLSLLNNFIGWLKS
uniref:C2H2-type domain-containing protein n=1 Tax=Elaeophora elaphi TaxID=1147741 RepID=A0A0R3S5I0_9BILA